MANPGILLYDGDCGFCTTSARWIERRWRPGAAVAVASSSVTDADLSSWGLTRAGVEEAVCFVHGGTAVSGARAVGAALRAAGGPLALLGAVVGARSLRGVTERAYRAVARHRHRFPGSTDACRTSPT